jgi:hypothetical protein
MILTEDVPMRKILKGIEWDQKAYEPIAAHAAL